MKYSVIIPLYNKGKKVKNAIDSILLQGFNDIEIVVVDDGSTDDSALYVKNYKDKNVKYIYKENGGVSSARNKGIQEAKGDWILLLDADDELFPNTISTYESLMLKYPRASVLVQRQDLYDKSGFLKNLLFRYKTAHETQHPFLALWLFLCFPCPGNYCFKKSLYQQACGFDTRISFWEDFDFARRIIKHQRMAFSSHLAAKYNQTTTGLSGSSHTKECEMAYFIPEILAKEKTSVLERALLYNNIEQEIAWWQGDSENIDFYRDMQCKHFAWYFKQLHWLRQQLHRHGII